MLSRQANSVFHYLRKVAAANYAIDCADQELLDGFLTQRDQAAFAALVRRYGPMVLRLCLRILRHEQDAADAFQATFLVLSVKAASLRPQTSLGGWLYSVAYRTAQKARIDAARRRKHEDRTPVAESADPLAEITGRETQEILDRELALLPDKFRDPLVLCYLEDLSRVEAARRLGWPVSLLKSRLEQARARLRARLVSRGLEFADTSGDLPCQNGMASVAVPPVLFVSTVQAATTVAAGGTMLSVVPASVATLTEGVLRVMILTKLKSAVLSVLLLGVLCLGVGVAAQRVLAGKAEGDEGPAFERARGDSVRLPQEMVAKVGLKVAEVKTRPALKPTVLELPGSTALDPEKLLRIHARFAPAEVVEIGKLEWANRELRVGDKVKEGQLLAVVFSADVAQKKGDLFNAVVQLKLDEAILARAEAAAEAIPEVTLLNYRRNVVADRNAIARAVNTLRTLGIPDKDIESVQREAEDAAAKPQLETDEIRKARPKRWGKVELRAPAEGTIVERNLSKNEVVADGTVILFQIANLDRLLIIVNIPEDRLAELNQLPAGERRWTIRVVGAAPIPGVIDEIGYLIDPNQHTAVLKGHIENKDRQVRAGQYITVTITLPPPQAELVIPAAALVEQGQQSFVFVQPDPKQTRYELRRVLVVRRGADAVHIAARLTAEQEQNGFQTLRPGDRIITTGALELKAILDELKAAQGR
jgi:cobalt-zinc-cadmium efflux system membrane fusion protein